MSQISAAPRASSKAAVLKNVRQLHLWLGTFFAPAIIFFAFTGALQTFSLHEKTPGSSYQPPAWIVKLAQIHKKQTLATRPPGPPRAKQPRRNEEPPKPPENSAFVIVLKSFVFLMAMGLIATTALGIYMAFKFSRDVRVIWSLLALGTILPVGLTFFI